MSQSPTEEAAAAIPPANEALRRVLMVVWMAIALGVVLQSVILIGKTAAGAPVPGLRWLPDLANGITWAVFVCAGVVVGTVASRARSAVMGLLGLISAPIAFSLAKGVQRGLQTIIDAPVDRITPLLYTITAIKAVEYAALGAALGWLLTREAAKALHFALAGAAAGVLFGLPVVWLQATQGKAKPPALVGATINELMFPIGCAVVIYVATYAARHLRLTQAELDPGSDAGIPLA